mmetsp:Transcript_36768/g.78357  ORF Transcript_36768/g.78357 Transcript_36768/m.78357 type:complete len:211 (+) Transcript_36768:974-1606(+)
MFFSSASRKYRSEAAPEASFGCCSGLCSGSSGRSSDCCCWFPMLLASPPNCLSPPSGLPPYCIVPPSGLPPFNWAPPSGLPAYCWIPPSELPPYGASISSRAPRGRATASGQSCCYRSPSHSCLPRSEDVSRTLTLLLSSPPPRTALPSLLASSSSCLAYTPKSSLLLGASKLPPLRWLVLLEANPPQTTHCTSTIAMERRVSGLGGGAR